MINFNNSFYNLIFRFIFRMIMESSFKKEYKIDDTNRFGMITKSQANDTILAKVNGESMINVGINSGDFLIVRKNLNPPNFQIVVASVNGNRLVKRFLQNKNNIYLISENRNFPLIKIKKTDDFKIIGEVVSVIKNV